MVSVYMWHISEHLCSQKIASIILIIFTAHHTPSIIRNGTSWLNMGISSDRNLLFWEFPYPLKWKQASLLNITGVRSHPPAYSPWGNHFTKFTYVSYETHTPRASTAATTTAVLTYSTRVCVGGPLIGRDVTKSVWQNGVPIAYPYFLTCYALFIYHILLCVFVPNFKFLHFLYVCVCIKICT